MVNASDSKVSVVGVVFRSNGQVYFFAPLEGLPLKARDQVLVETMKGQEVGEVRFVSEVSARLIETQLKKVLRLATPEELKLQKEHRAKEKDALRLCQDKINEFRLPMKLVEAQYAFDGKRLTFTFTAEGRVDFRDLVKELARVFATRIDLKQIGPRDEAKVKDGMGICGEHLCCSRYLNRPLSPSLKMAREQQLNTRNTEKMSGLCGRLKCCVQYEFQVYEELRAKMPPIGTLIDYQGAKARVVDQKVIKQALLVVYPSKEGREVLAEVPLAELTKETVNQGK